MTTIKIKHTTSNWEKTDFNDSEELLDYLLQKSDIGRLYELKSSEINDKRNKDWNEVDEMDNSSFIDVR